MWRIRVNQLYSEVGGLISTGHVKFTNSLGFDRSVEGKVTSPGRGYETTLQGGRGDGKLQVEHDDRVIVDFEVLEITEDDDEASYPQPC